VKLAADGCSSWKCIVSESRTFAVLSLSYAATYRYHKCAVVPNLTPYVDLGSFQANEKRRIQISSFCHRGRKSLCVGIQLQTISFLILEQCSSCRQRIIFHNDVAAGR
jgi:hypothetical protein